MSFREARSRPAIKPIRTDHSGLDLAAPSHGVLSSLNSPGLSATSISPGFRPPALYPRFHDNGMKLHDKAAVDRLDSKSRMPNRREWSASPTLLRTLGEISLPTPTTKVPTAYPLSASIVEPGNGHRRGMAAEFNTSKPCDPASTAPFSGIRPIARRQSAPSGAAAFRHLRFQQFRENLWRQGANHVGNVSRADNFVVPTALRRAFVSPSNPSGAAILQHYHPHKVRAVVHKRTKPSIALSRDFDLDALRATVPEPLPTPTTPHFDHGTSPMDLAMRNGLPSPSPQAAPDSRVMPNTPRLGSARAWSPMSARSNRSMGRWDRPVPMPIHLLYARAQLPVLASFMMSNPVSLGDVIEIPVPFPAAWMETVKFVYTGREELATEQVKQNILYLGGRV